MSKKKVWRAKNVKAVLEMRSRKEILRAKGVDPAATCRPFTPKMCCAASCDICRMIPA